MSPDTGFYDLHGVCLRAGSPDGRLFQRLDAIFAPLAAQPRPPDIDLRLRLVDELPPWQPAGQTVSQSRLLRCALEGHVLSAYFPRWGAISVDLASGAIEGDLLPQALSHYGALDDMIIIVLGPLLRRRGFFSLHAFAAASTSGDGAEELQAVLLVGDIGAGKTTTGLSLLEAGWKLLSNDSPLLSRNRSGVVVHAYPGLLAAYDDTLARFPSLHRLAGRSGTQPAKRAFAAQEVYADVWRQRAPARLLLFPQITPGLAASRAEPLAAPDALLALMPNSIEHWDREYIPRHLAVLQGLVSQAAAYRLLLAPDVAALPRLIEGLIATSAA